MNYKNLGKSSLKQYEDDIFDQETDVDDIPETDFNDE